jgi:Tfp pilus assembly protein PilO
MHTTFFRIIDRELFALGILGAGILLFLCTVRFIGIPQYDRLLHKHSEIKAYQSVLASKDNHAVIKAGILDIRSQLQEKLDSLTAGQGAASNISGLLEMLIDQARKADVRFVKMQPLEEKADNDMILYPVLLETTTTYNSLGRFIASLESVPHTVRVDRIGITSGAGQAITANILVTCYLQREKS